MTTEKISKTLQNGRYDFTSAGWGLLCYLLAAFAFISADAAEAPMQEIPNAAVEGSPAGAAAEGSDKFELRGKEHLTAVSGYAGGWEELGRKVPYQALNDIVWGEKSDEPCGLYINTGHINKLTQFLDPHDMPSENEADPLVFGAFEIKEDPLDVYIVGTENLRGKDIKLDCNGNLKAVSTVGNDKFVYKLRTCSTDKRDTSGNKLKGIEIWNRTLVYKKNYKEGQAPELIDEPTPQKDQHAHCEKWHTAVACDAGEVATGLRVHYNTVGGKDTVTGLGLICKRVELKEAALQDVRL